MKIIYPWGYNHFHWAFCYKNRRASSHVESSIYYMEAKYSSLLLTWEPSFAEFWIREGAPFSPDSDDTGLPPHSGPIRYTGHGWEEGLSVWNASPHMWDFSSHIHTTQSKAIQRVLSPSFPKVSGVTVLKIPHVFGWEDHLCFYSNREMRFHGILNTSFSTTIAFYWGSSSE